MRTVLAVCVLTVIVVSASAPGATEYFGIDQFMGGDVTLDLDLWDPYFIVGADYHVHRLDWTITNNGPNTYYDVKLVVPFAWLKVDGAIDEYDYVDASGEWHWSDATDDFYLKPDTSVYVPASAPLSYTLMSDTDLPLSYDWDGQVAMVLSSDSVPTWDVSLTLSPGQTISVVTTYLEQETDSRVSGIWVQPYTVAVIPEPGLIALMAAGAVPLVLSRRRR